MKPLVSVLLAIVSSSGSVLAADYYVDVQNGSDAASGTSPAAAWRTLTFAAAQAASGAGNTIHVAPGTYSPVSGEIFPLTFHGQALVGDQGSGVTTIDAGGGAHVLEMFNSPPTPVPGALSLLRGVTLQNGVGGIRIEYTWSGITLSVEDVVIRNMSSFGISARSDLFTGSGANFHVTLRRSRIDHCTTGIATSGASGPNSIEVQDSQITNCSSRGLDFVIRSALSLRIERTRITGHGLGGLQMTGQNFGFATIEVRDCLIADCLRGYVASSGFQSNVATTFRRCTIAANSQDGIASDPSGGLLNPAFVLESTLVHSNGTDVVTTIPPTLLSSQVGGPDPLFRSPATLDYRVYFGSPVIDAGDPATPVGTPDIAGLARAVDGDLDTVERADIGCHEFQTLDIDFPGPIGTVLTLEIFGPSGATNAMRLSRGPTVAPGATAFGQFDLHPSLNFAWVTFPALRGPGTLFQRTIPPDPIFIGQTYSFQGLVTSAASPSGAAWSNAVSLTITP